MDLNEYLPRHKITEAKFAEQIGTSQPTVNRMRKGQLPSKELMVAIFEATKGAVRADDFFDLPSKRKLPN